MDSEALLGAMFPRVPLRVLRADGSGMSPCMPTLFLVPGAEMLSAEFVHKTQSEPVQKRTSASSCSGLETKRPKMLKNSDVKKAPVTESAAKPVKSKVKKSVVNRPSKPHTQKPAESGKNAAPYGNIYLKNRAIHHRCQIMTRQW